MVQIDPHHAAIVAVGAPVPEAGILRRNVQLSRPEHRKQIMIADRPAGKHANVGAGLPLIAHPQFAGEFALRIGPPR